MTGALTCQCGLQTKNYRGMAIHRRHCMFAPRAVSKKERARQRYAARIEGRPLTIEVVCVECGERMLVMRKLRGRKSITCSKPCRNRWRRMRAIRLAALERLLRTREQT